MNTTEKSINESIDEVLKAIDNLKPYAHRDSSPEKDQAFSAYGKICVENMPDILNGLINAQRQANEWAQLFQEAIAMSPCERKTTFVEKAEENLKLKQRAELADAIINAWTVMGKNPHTHKRAQENLSRDWPTLANAIIRAANKVI